MSQTHAVAIPSRSRGVRWFGPLILVTVVLALVALALVQDDGGKTKPSPTASEFTPPPLATARPDESKVAAAIGAGVTSTPSPARPDESKIAPAIGSAFDPAPGVGRPDESNVAAAIGGTYGNAPKRKGQPYVGGLGSLSQADRDAAPVRGR
jgi:hypothetical protein